jgi:hypothetical protein
MDVENTSESANHPKLHGRAEKQIAPNTVAPCFAPDDAPD